MRVETYRHAVSWLGHARLPPEEIAALTGKGGGELVAASAIVFGPLGSAFNLRLAPYFLAQPRPAAPPRRLWRIPWRHWFWNTVFWLNWGSLAIMAGSVLLTISDGIGQRWQKVKDFKAVARARAPRPEASPPAPGRVATQQSLAREPQPQAFPAAISPDIPTRNHRRRSR